MSTGVPSASGSPPSALDSEDPFPYEIRGQSPNHTVEYQDLIVERLQYSESSQILYVINHDTGESFVVKALRAYKDTRLSLETLEERHCCLLEALRCNRVFSPEIYLGLIRIEDKIDAHTQHIRFGKIFVDPHEGTLEPTTEYALVMRRLTEAGRLDVLLDAFLKANNEEALWENVGFLTGYISHIHSNSLPPVQQGEKWGDYKQLHEKLKHNLGLLDQVLFKDKQNRLSGTHKLEEIILWVKDTFCRVATQSCYQHYFDRRVKEGFIRRCHGDLKAQHIWIITGNPINGEGTERRVFILDAIDFNPMYNNIDILSDFAMLVVELQAHTHNPSLANQMIKCYLQHTNQQNETAYAVLDYYLIEKAIVGAAINIVYADAYDLGMYFLEVAKQRLESLEGVFGM